MPGDPGFVTPQTRERSLEDPARSKWGDEIRLLVFGARVQESYRVRISPARA